MKLKENGKGWCGLDLFGTGEGMTTCCERGNESCLHKKSGIFFPILGSIRTLFHVLSQ
jgi:hypothetical protein